MATYTGKFHRRIAQVSSTKGDNSVTVTTNGGDRFVIWAASPAAVLPRTGRDVDVYLDDYANYTFS